MSLSAQCNRRASNGPRAPPRRAPASSGGAPTAIASRQARPRRGSPWRNTWLMPRRRIRDALRRDCRGMAVSAARAARQARRCQACARGGAVIVGSGAEATHPGREGQARVMHAGRSKKKKRPPAGVEPEALNVHGLHGSARGRPWSDKKVFPGWMETRPRISGPIHPRETRVARPACPGGRREPDRTRCFRDLPAAAPRSRCAACWSSRGDRTARRR